MQKMSQTGDNSIFDNGRDYPNGITGRPALTVHIRFRRKCVDGVTLIHRAAAQILGRAQDHGASTTLMMMINDADYL